MDRYAWLIWSIEHNAWWKAGHNGYTEMREEAGRYSFDAAITIVSQANKYRRFTVPNEAMVRDESECCKAPMVAEGLQCESCGSSGV